MGYIRIILKGKRVKVSEGMFVKFETLEEKVNGYLVLLKVGEKSRKVTNKSFDHTNSYQSNPFKCYE